MEQSEDMVKQIKNSKQSQDVRERAQDRNENFQ